MAEESFMMISLKESQSKKLAQVISNETARKILDFLTEHEFSTETKIAQALKLPLSTVHYNMKALVESKLVVADEYHYSEKGKEVPHYKLAKKFIIIAPKEEEGVMERLKKFWPISAIAVAAGAVIVLAQRLFRGGLDLAAKNADTLAAPLARMAVENGEQPLMDTAIQTTGAGMQEMAKFAANETVQQVVAPIIVRQDPSPFFAGGWFVAGALFVVLLVVLWGIWKRKK